MAWPCSALSAESGYATSDTPGREQVEESDDFKVVDVANLEIWEGLAGAVDRYNSFEELEFLCATIRDIGLREPIVVRPIPTSTTITEQNQKYQIIDGVRRLAALRHLGVKTTPVIIKNLDDYHARLYYLHVNIFLPLTEQDEKRARMIFADDPVVMKWFKIIDKTS